MYRDSGIGYRVSGLGQERYSYRCSPIPCTRLLSLDFGKFPVLEKTLNRGCFFLKYVHTPFSFKLLKYETKGGGRMKMKHVLVAFMVLGLAFTMPAPAFSQAKSDTIKIGAFLPMTGGVAAYGQGSWQGIQFARE